MSIDNTCLHEEDCTCNWFFCIFGNKVAAMNKKLTLTIDQTVIKKAKAYAQESGRSLSSIVENYFKALTGSRKEKKEDEELSPIVKELRGSIPLPPDFDYKEERLKRLTEKYLK